MILDGQPGKMCRRHRLSEDSARGGKASQRCMEISAPEAEPGNSGEGKESQELNTAGEESEKTQGQRSAEGRGCLLMPLARFWLLL